MQIELLVALVAVAVLLGLAVGVLARKITQQRRLAREAEQATLRGRVKAGVRKGAERVARESVKASRKSAWWMFKRRFRRDPKDGED